MGIEEIDELAEQAREAEEIGTNEVLDAGWFDREARRRRRVGRVKHLTKHVPEKYLASAEYRPVRRKGYFLYYKTKG